MPGQAFDHMAVAIAGGKVHVGVDRRRVRAQDLFDMAEQLDELAPVGRCQQAQAGDAVADGHLVTGLLLGIHLHQAFDRKAGLTERLFYPRHGQYQRGALSVQSARQFRNEGWRHRRRRSRHVGNGQYHALGVALGHFDQSIGPVIGKVTVIPVGHDPGRHAPQVLDQRQAQHDRDGPQLAQGQRRDGLIRGDETVQAWRVDPAIAVRDGFQGDVVDPRQACRGPFGQAWQLAAVAVGQVGPGGADVFFDQVEVVQQPFRRRGGASTGLLNGLERCAATFQQQLVVGQAAEQGVLSGKTPEHMLAGQDDAVVGHLLRIEQVGTQDGLVLELVPRGTPPEPDGR
ncbi:hypothetical protein D3C73_923670 [compost metagenome]